MRKHYTPTTSGNKGSDETVDEEDEHRVPGAYNKVLIANFV
jgi:hypothetical protein